MKIYCARPISGLTPKEILNYYRKVNKDLKRMGYEVLYPMIAKGYMRTEIKFRACDFGNPCSTNHAIKERDQWMVQSADIVFMNLYKAESVSIGCVSELAWADYLHKHTVVVMEPNNIHRHAFMLEMADVLFESYDEAMDYLKKVVQGTV